MILSCQRALLLQRCSGIQNLKDEVQSAESFDSRNAGVKVENVLPASSFFTQIWLCYSVPASSNLWEILSFQPLWGAAAAAPPFPQRPAFSAFEAFMSLRRALPFLLE